MDEKLKIHNFTCLLDIFRKHSLPNHPLCSTLFIKNYNTTIIPDSYMPITHEEFINTYETIINQFKFQDNPGFKIKRLLPTKDSYKESPNLMHLNILMRSISYFNLFEILGYKFSIHLLTECCVVCKYNDFYFLVSGNLSTRKNQFHNCVFLKPKLISHKQFMASLDLNNIKLNFINESKFFSSFYNAKFMRRIRSIKYMTIYKNIFEEYLKYEEKDCKNKFVDSAVDLNKIANFLFVMAKKVLLTTFKGTNLDILKTKIFYFIHLQKNENIVINELVRGFKLSKISFMKGDAKKYDLDMFKNFMQNFFMHYINLVLNRFFYFTESSFAGSKYLFYVKSFWIDEEKKLAESYLKDFINVKTDVTSRECKMLMYPSLRFVPKESSFRPIINHNISNSSLNKYSKNVVLRTPHRMLNSIFKSKYQDVKTHKNEIIEQVFKFGVENNDKFIYIVKMDIKNCFDSINTKKLLNILKKLIDNKEYFLRTYQEIKINSTGIKKTIKASMNHSKDPFHIFIKNYINDKDVIYKDGYYYYKTKEELYKIIRDELTNNIFQYKNNTYKRKEGVTQGSVLSSLLCNIYLLDLEDDLSNIRFKNGRIFRYIDDFLFMSTEIDDVKNYSQIAAKLSLFNMRINNDKLCANFDMKNPEKINLRDKNMYVTWCGYKLFGKNFAVKTLYKKHLLQSFIYDSNQPGMNFRKKVLWNLKTRLTNVLVNVDNRFLYQNVYENMLLFYKRIIFNANKMPFKNNYYMIEIVTDGRKLLKQIFRNNSVVNNAILENIVRCAIKKSNIDKILDIDK